MELNAKVLEIIHQKLDEAYENDKQSVFSRHTALAAIDVRHMLRVLKIPTLIPLLLIDKGEYVAGKRDTFHKLCRGQVMLLGFVDFFGLTLVFTIKDGYKYAK
jgi:hypothetical protein